MRIRRVGGIAHHLGPLVLEIEDHLRIGNAAMTRLSQPDRETGRIELLSRRRIGGCDGGTANVDHYSDRL